jgi:non-reducing end alpha-L-arabinofuranosidase
MEVGVYMGSNETSLPLIDFWLALVKGNSGNHFSVKMGDAQVTMVTLYDGARPPGYETMRKQGAIALGIGGDNSP